MIFAKIDFSQNPGVVVNIQMMGISDPQDPAFTWTDITNYNPQPQIGWTTTDAVNFTTNISGPTLPQAIQANLLEFQSAVQTFVDAHYSLEIRFNFMAIYTLAVQNNLTNRATYITQLFTWAESVVSYCATYVASVQALTSVADVQASTWDLTQIASDPMVTTIAAIAIND